MTVPFSKYDTIYLISDVEYKRLGKEGTSKEAKTSGHKANRGLWFIPSAIRHTKTLESIKSKVTAKGTSKSPYIFPIP